MSLKLSRLTVSAIALSAALLGSASAQDRPTDPTMQELLDLLVGTGVVTQEQADALVAKARERAAADEADGVIRVPYVPQSVRDSIRDEVREDVVQTAREENWAQPDALPKWLNRFHFYGDVRARFEGQLFQDNNAIAPDPAAVNAASDGGADGFLDRLEALPLLNTQDDRYRARFRARLGVRVDLGQWAEADLRFVTGNPENPLSVNQTLEGNFDGFVVALDRALLRLRPLYKSATFGGSSLTLGKFDNPFFSTELMFDPDLQFEGAAATLQANLDGAAGVSNVFVTAGAFPLNEIAFTGNEVSDPVLYAGQVGAQVRPTDRVRISLGGGFFFYDNVRGEENDIGLRTRDASAPATFGFGNTLINIRNDDALENTVRFGLASQFQVAQAVASVEFDLTENYSATVFGEYAVNTAFDRDALVDRVPGFDGQDIVLVPITLPSSGDTAYNAFASFGHKDIAVLGGAGRTAWSRNAWRVTAGYRYMEADSTYSAFTDSSFGLGGTDQEGLIVEFAYGLSEHLLLEGRWIAARSIDFTDPATGLDAPSIDTDTIFIDLTGRF